MKSKPKGEHIGGLETETFPVGKVTYGDGSGFYVLAKIIKNGDKSGFRLIGSEDYNPSNLKGWRYFYIGNNWSEHAPPLEDVDAIIRFVINHVDGVEGESSFDFDEYFHMRFKDKIDDAATMTGRTYAI